MSLRDELSRVIYRISWGLDEGDIDLIAASFTEDAVMSIRIGDRDADPIGPLEGRAAIQKLHADALAEQTDQRRHQITNLWVDQVSDTDAVVVSNLTLLSIADGKMSVLSSGWYRDSLTRTRGDWQIKERYLYLDLPY